MVAVAFPNPDRVNLPREFQNLKTQEIGAHVANIAAEEAADTGTIGSVSKIARSAIKLGMAVNSISKELGNGIVSHLSAIIDTFKVLGIFKHVKTIVDNSSKKEDETKSEKHQRGLKTAQATTGIAVATMTGVKLADNFKLLKIANISKGLGITSLKAPLAAALSFPVVYSVLEIVENTFGMIASSLKMHDVNKKMKAAKDHKEIWNKPLLDILEVYTLTSKSAHIATKRDAVRLEAETKLAPKVEETKLNYVSAKRKYREINRRSDSFFKKCSLKIAEGKLKKAASKHTEACKKLDAKEAIYDKMGTKIERWKVIEDKFATNALTEEDTTTLTAMKESKMAKWKTKIKNITWDKVKEGLSLGMSVFLTIFLITTITLAIVFPVTLPLGAILGLSIGGLILSIGMTAKHLMPKFMRLESCGQKPHKPVEVPQLAALAQV